MRHLAALPKAHLHVHLEGAMRPATLAELAAEAGVPVPQVRGFGTFGAFAEMYVAACAVLTSEASLRRLVDEVVADAALAGAVWVEPATYIPQHRELLGPDEHVLEVILDELVHAGTRHGIGTGLLIAADRTLDPADAVAQARLAVRHAADGVVSFGLHNDETGFPPEPFAEAFDIALAGGLLSAPHAGELEGPASVVGALEALGAHRIQHGVRAVEDPDLVVRLAAADVCLDVCPSSNVLLGVFPSIADHPLPDLLAAGVSCSLNADDPLLFGPGLLEEYVLCRDEMGLTDCDLAAIARSSIRASGAPDALKARADNAVDLWMAADAEDAVA
ncbi:adenosine deaminase [Aquihabitans sp. G128]|uniref:adenosine deaminase n=1 Tax=Aquihabitans sp. G128 TaxID=2849779 RepID=UPI001C22FC01|nr:adenosine deaminase [Aquihabitans sp. G128]QXC60201.1 adenosine deaminase [Aquihabitans sp. G128]